MDASVGEALQGLVRMIDNVNDRSMLNGLSFDLTLVLAAAMRRNGLLNDMEVGAITQAFDYVEADWREGEAEGARKVLTSARALWDASAST